MRCWLARGAGALVEEAIHERRDGPALEADVAQQAVIQGLEGPDPGAAPALAADSPDERASTLPDVNPGPFDDCSEPPASVGIP
jgi:hypothetical protein